MRRNIVSCEHGIYSLPVFSLATIREERNLKTFRYSVSCRMSKIPIKMPSSWSAYHCEILSIQISSDNFTNNRHHCIRENRHHLFVLLQLFQRPAKQRFFPCRYKEHSTLCKPYARLHVASSLVNRKRVPRFLPTIAKEILLMANRRNNIRKVFKINPWHHDFIRDVRDIKFGTYAFQFPLLKSLNMSFNALSDM